MKLLALDTSTDACSAAVYADKVIHERYQVAPRQHARLLLAMVDAVLGEAQLNLLDLDALAFGRGPGSFTGVRIAAATAQGLAIGANRPVIPVSSLRALAQTAYSAQRVRRCAAAFDARMDEVYYAAFEIDADGIAQLVQEERVCLPEDLPHLSGVGWTGVGPGWQAYESRLCARLGASIERIFANVLPHAGDVAALGASGLLRGEAVSAETALPVYLRDRVTRT